MNNYRLGNAFMKHVGGVAIGGPVSGVVLKACCSVLEYRFDTFIRFELCRSWGLKGKRGGDIASARYAENI